MRPGPLTFAAVAALLMVAGSGLRSETVGTVKAPDGVERRHEAAGRAACVMPDIGHFMMLEDPDEFNRLLARAVRDLLATP